MLRLRLLLTDIVTNMKISIFQKTSVLLVVFAIAASAFAQTGKIENLAAQAALVSEFAARGITSLAVVGIQTQLTGVTIGSTSSFFNFGSLPGSLPIDVDGGVGDDACQPGNELTITPEAADRAKGFQKSLLDGILGIGLVAQVPQGDAFRIVPVAAD